ncbi:MAG: decarboxylating 6-phosphogluconate dehydrogenase [Desulfomonilaceae bacterium]|nr:decarboxylating 6-phosphogluconate dehydrogenase [Desulfomonilaceae bacterium]
MKLAMIGLGKMGFNMAKRLLQGGHTVVVHNRTSERTDEAARQGAVPAYSLTEVVQKLSRPRVVWIMLPAGPVVDEHVREFGRLLDPGDIVVDGGNSYFEDDLKHESLLKEKGVRYMDAGVSGGVWGLQIGYCLMVGGDPEVYRIVEPALETLAPKDGYLHCGPVGSGHFVKMVHNGIEYGMMQAYAEGFEILFKSRFSQSMDFRKIAHLWNQGSVIRSWLLELAEAAFSKDPDLASIKGQVADSGEGRWTVRQAVDLGVSAPVIAASLFTRFASRTEDSFGNKVLAALRHEFGGHAVVKEE